MKYIKCSLTNIFNLANRVQTLFEEALHPRPEVRGFTACRVKITFQRVRLKLGIFAVGF